MAERVGVTVTVTNNKTGETESREISYASPNEVDYKVSHLVGEAVAKWNGVNYSKDSAMDKVLTGLYIEQLKDIPELTRVTPDVVGVTPQEYNASIRKLDQQGYIEGVKSTKMKYLLDFAYVTKSGLNYVESMVDVDEKAEKSEKAESVMKKVASFGWDRVESWSSKVIAELIDKQMKGL